MKRIKVLHYLIIFITIFMSYDCGNFLDGAWGSSGNPLVPSTYDNSSYAYIYKLKVVRNYLFMGASGGIYRSTDNGLSWSLLHNGIDQFNVSLEEVTNDGKVFVFQSEYDTISSSRSLFVSKDFGNTWTRQSYLDESEYQLRDGSVYAKDENNIFMPCTLIKKPDETEVRQAIIRSTDGGNSWKIVYQWYYPFGYMSTFPVVFQPNGDIYALGSPILKSTDNGLTWDSVGIVEDPFWDSTPAQGEINSTDQIYLLYSDNDMFVSNDLGKTWTVLKKDIESFSICSNSEIFVNQQDEGIFKSTDYGLTWENVNKSINGSLYIDGKDEIFLYSTNSIIESKDYGTSWQKIKTPF